MSDVVNLGKRVSQIDVSPQFNNYTKVVIHVDDETDYISGNDTGRTLEINNPIMTVNGIEKEIDPGNGTTPVIVEDRTLVPIRAVIESLGIPTNLSLE